MKINGFSLRLFLRQNSRFKENSWICTANNNKRRNLKGWTRGWLRISFQWDSFNSLVGVNSVRKKQFWVIVNAHFIQSVIVDGEPKARLTNRAKFSLQITKEVCWSVVCNYWSVRMSWRVKSCLFKRSRDGRSLKFVFSIFVKTKESWWLRFLLPKRFWDGGEVRSSRSLERWSWSMTRDGHFATYIGASTALVEKLHLRIVETFINCDSAKLLNEKASSENKFHTYRTSNAGSDRIFFS